MKSDLNAYAQVNELISKLDPAPAYPDKAMKTDAEKRNSVTRNTI